MLFWLIPLVIVSNVIMLQKKLNIGLLMFVNCVWIAVGKGIGPVESLQYLTKGVMGSKTLNLLSVFLVILLLESVMRQNGYISLMVEGLKGIFGISRLAPCVMPIFIGMLPSPGGARLSCPMVEETTAHSQLQADKAYTNYWYRHIWMDGFILYPPMLMAAKILDKSVLQLFTALLPVMAVWFVIGVLVGLRRFEKKTGGTDYALTNRMPQMKVGFKIFLSGVYPIITMITLYIVLLHFGISIALHIAGALVISLILILNKSNRHQIKANLKDAMKPKFAVIILGAITFSEFFKGAGFIDEMILWMEMQNIPMEALIIILPLVTGLLSGISLTFVSVSFPILMGLRIGQDMSLFVLAYTSGVIGVMLTPLHLCSVVSADYFDIPLPKLIGRVALSCLLLIPAVALFVSM